MEKTEQPNVCKERLKEKKHKCDKISKTYMFTKSTAMIQP